MTNNPAAEMAARDGRTGHDVADPDLSLADDAPSEEITAAAERQRQAAAALGQQAARDQAEAGEILAAARDEAARIMAAAEAEAQPLAASAAAATREAGARTESARVLAGAAAMAAEDEAADARVRALEDERAGLDEKQAELGRRWSERDAQRRELEPQLAAALDGDDLDLITTLRTKLDNIRAHQDALRAQQAPIIARLQEIGDGEMSPIWPQKELAEARRVADPERRRVRGMLNAALPDRPEAAVDKARRDAQIMDRIRQERAAAERNAPGPRRYVTGRP